MKILYIVNSLSVGGAETIAANYAVELSKRGHDVSMIQIKNENTFLKDMVVDAGIPLYTTERLASDAGGDSSENGQNLREDISTISNNIAVPQEKSSVSHTGSKPRINPLTRKIDKLISIIRFCHYIRKINPDVIHIHTGLEKFRFVRSFPANRIFFTVHSEWSKCKDKGPNHKRMLYELIQKGMNVIALSSKGMSDIREEFPGAKVTVLPNGMDLDAIRESAYDRAFLSKELGLSTVAFVMGHVGRFHPVKNHEKLIRVFEAVCGICDKVAGKNNWGPSSDKVPVLRNNDNTTTDNGTVIRNNDRSISSSPILLLIGSGSESEQATIHTLVDNSPVKDRIIFAGVRRDATAIMGALDAVVMTSFSEAFPLVPMEAQIVGTRCVLSDVIPEEVFCNDNCIPMSLSASDEAWAKAILGDLTVNNWHSLEQFSLSSVIDRHVEMYEHC